MKCPIPFVTLAVDSFPPDYERRDCLQEECAWWEEAQDNCSIKVIGRGLEYISTDLTQILENRGELRPK